MPLRKRVREKGIVQGVLTALRSIGAKVIKTHGDPFATSGTPDLFGVWEGVPFLIEMKTETGTVGDLQELEMQDWRTAGAISFSAHSKAEALTTFVHEMEERGKTVPPFSRRPT